MQLFWFTVVPFLFIAFFAGTEIAFSTSNGFRIELHIKHGGIGASILQLFLKNTSLFRASLLIGYYLSSISFALAIVLFLRSKTGELSFVPMVLVLLIAALISTFIIIITELIARILIGVNPNKVLNALLPPAVVFFVLFLPASWFLVKIGEFIRGLFLKNKNLTTSILLSKTIVDQWLTQNYSQRKEKQMENQELKMFQKALGFSKIRIRDCMIPRTEIEAIDINAGIDVLKKKFTSTGYSKIIVYRNSVDNIIGYINSKELFKHPSTIKEKLTDISFVPETMPASKMLHDFMQYHRSVAIVVDEYGGVSGMVTLEDIMEEIFGEIKDEHDTDDWIEKQVNNNEFVLSGRLEIEYLNSGYGLNIPELEDYDTLAGFILFHYHTLPKPNEIIKVDRFSFKILKVSNTRIELVHLKVLEF